jgi:4-hydroxy 2-oxovalerate aldolase
MVDAKDLTRSSTNPIFSMFCRHSESPVSLVRIATDVSDLPACEKLCGALKLLGYTVALNLMKFTELSVNELALGAASIEAWESVDVLYLADSFGNWSPDAVEETLRNIRSRWSKDIGVHAHDNRGYALINTVKAHVTEARWLDGTICGMGRGAGNARMEMLMQEVGYSPKYRPEALHSFAIDVVALMQAQHQWGPNPLYALSAQLGIHPSYTQEMLQENIPCDAIAAVLRALKREGGRSFDPRRLSEALHACQRTGT